VTSSLDERLAEATVGALELFGVYLGTRLNLYRTLHDGGPQRVDEFAKVAQVDPRYARVAGAASGRRHDRGRRSDPAGRRAALSAAG
jgi:hypothetical protein